MKKLLGNLLGIIVVLFALFWAYVTPVFTFQITNNSQEDFTLLIGDAELYLEKNKMLEHNVYRFHPLKGYSRYKPVEFDFQIKRDAKLWQYRFFLPTIESEFVDCNPFILCEISLQINEDGLIYLLLIGQSAPTQELADQPEGFPVRPEHILLFRNDPGRPLGILQVSLRVGM